MRKIWPIFMCSSVDNKQGSKKMHRNFLKHLEIIEEDRFTLAQITRKQMALQCQFAV